MSYHSTGQTETLPTKSLTTPQLVSILETMVPKPPAKKPFPWLAVIAGVGVGLFILTRRSKR